MFNPQKHKLEFAWACATFLYTGLKDQIKTLYSFQKCLLNRNRVRSSQSRGGKKGSQQVREIGPFSWCICWGVGGRVTRGVARGSRGISGKMAFHQRPDGREQAGHAECEGVERGRGEF